MLNSVTVKFFNHVFGLLNLGHHLYQSIYNQMIMAKKKDISLFGHPSVHFI